MSTLILVATGSLGGVIGAAAMFIPAKLCRDDAHTFMERGEQTFGKAEKLVAEHERTRDLPWHYADEHVTGEVLAVASVSATPALSAQSHEDEQAPAEDDDHTGAWWLPVMTLPLLLARAYGYALGWVQRGGRWLLDSLLLGVAMVASALGKLRSPKPQPKRGRHWASDVNHTREWAVIRRRADHGEMQAEAEQIEAEAILNAHRRATSEVSA